MAAQDGRKEIPKGPEKEYWRTECEQPAGTMLDCGCGNETVPIISDAEKLALVQQQRGNAQS